MMFEGLDFNDPEWTRMHGGYRVPYDARPALRALEKGDPSAWDELWTELHHQGDLGEASYAAVPHLVRIHEQRALPEINTYLMAAVIEMERLRVSNPDLPAKLAAGYHAAWRRLVTAGIKDLAVSDEPGLVSSVLGVIAIGKRLPYLGHIAACYAEDKRQAMLDRYLT